jgi:hypothetical protein
LKAALEAFGSQGQFENNFGQSESPKLKRPLRRWYFLGSPHLRRSDQLLTIFSHPRSLN